MRKFLEFFDDETLAVDKLNEYIERAKNATNGEAKINVIGYQVVCNEQIKRTYILAEEVID